uniref:Protein kinase domain-containing protein n=1 Tax=Globodera rostochiensis TaxID=31243 RepID=A0A914GT45_GLORO
MTVESGGVEGGGDGAADGGGSSTTDGDAPPKKPPSEQPPRPATPSAAGGGRPAETGCKLLCDTDAGDPDDPEDDEILEESPCKRWSKRREKVKQRDVPGIDAAYLAMDNETGNEVVWNEVLFSERKNFRDQEEKIRAVFDNLIRLEHPNLVKFHKYWMDTKSDKPRIIFITEYMSSGSMSRFLQRARSSGSLLNIKAWKNWTRQILSALSYLHSCDPPIVHANLTSTSVFIQQNGLVKIGCVAPKTIHHHVKTFRENIKNVHYLAPEYDHQTETTIQADIYSFGVCALEMATTGALQSGCFNGASTSATTASTGLPSTASTSALLGTVAAAAAAAAIEKEKTAEPGGVAAPACGISSSASSSMLPVPAGNGVQPPQGSGAAGGGGGGSCFHMVTEEMVQKALHSLDQPEQKQFIERCLEHDPARRANVIELLDRLGPPEPDPDDTFDHNQHSQHEDGYITNHHHPHNFVVSAATNTASANVTSVDTNSLPPSITTALTTAPVTITKNTATVAPAPVPSITTSNATQTLSSATTTTTTTISSTIATIMTGSLTTTTAVTNNNINGGGNINGMLNALGNGGGGIAAVTTATTATDEGYHTNQSIVDGGGAGQTSLMNTNAFVNAVGGSAFGSSLHGHGHAETTVNGGCGTVVDPANVGIVQLPQNRETRQVVQLHAELLEPDSEGVATKLRVQLQLDDQMNRQLTASLREGDTADSLAADLVQNGFVSEANSSKVCELLTNVMSSRTVQLQQLRGRRGSSAASAEESSLPLVFKEVMNVDGGNGRIVGEKEEAKGTTTTRRRASPTHIQQQ